MKKRILLVLMTASLSISYLTGCSAPTKLYNKQEQNTDRIFGRFIEIPETYIFYNFRGFAENFFQWLVYDKDTKIVYIREQSNGGGLTYSPYYILDENNNPVIAIYNEEDNF